MAAGNSFSVAIRQNASVVTTGAQTSFTFDKNLVQLVSVTKGPAYGSAALTMGVAPQTIAQAIAAANTTGSLPNIASFYLPGGSSVPAGDQTFVTVAMTAKPGTAGGTSALTLSGVSMLNASGIEITP